VFFGSLIDPGRAHPATFFSHLDRVLFEARLYLILPLNFLQHLFFSSKGQLRLKYGLFDWMNPFPNFYVNSIRTSMSFYLNPLESPSPYVRKFADSFFFSITMCRRRQFFPFPASQEICVQLCLDSPPRLLLPWLPPPPFVQGICCPLLPLGPPGISHNFEFPGNRYKVFFTPSLYHCVPESRRSLRFFSCPFMWLTSL